MLEKHVTAFARELVQRHGNDATAALHALIEKVTAAQEGRDLVLAAINESPAPADEVRGCCYFGGGLVVKNVTEQACIDMGGAKWVEGPC